MDKQRARKLSHPDSTRASGTLQGVRIVEFAGIAGPFAA